MVVYSEKEILGDALATQKAATANFNTAANECVNEDVRQVMMNILEEEHDLSQDVFNMMHDKGFYPTPEADETKVEQVKQQYSSCVK
ncbi:MAG: spore coat protein [Lachnospira sp.]